jgi:3-oxoacyl-[acyl-carrier protein] reductase
VTGADVGIGQGIALAVAAAGADVAVHYPPVGPGPDETVAMLEQAGHAALPVEGDLGDPATCHAVVDKAAEKLGGFDALVNNAGVTRTAPFVDVDAEFFSTLLAVNFGGQFFCAQRAAKYFAEGSGGSIVNLSSVHASHGFPGFTVYAAAKGAIEAWTRTLAMELAPSIRVNAVAPGLVETPRVVRELANYSRERFGARNPMGRVGVPADIADVVIFLLSDTSRYMTGQVLHVDGGSTAR